VSDTVGGPTLHTIRGPATNVVLPPRLRRTAADTTFRRLENTPLGVTPSRRMHRRENDQGTQQGSDPGDLNSITSSTFSRRKDALVVGRWLAHCSQQSVHQGGDAPITVGGSFIDDAPISERIRFFGTGDFINLNQI
jgi:hypothetical protein